MQAILDFTVITVYVTAVLAAAGVVAGLAAQAIGRHYKFRQEWQEIKTVKKHDKKSIDIAI